LAQASSWPVSVRVCTMAHQHYSSTSGLLSWDEPGAAAAGGRRDVRSSNAFANGSNQNCGNVITDRSSTRIHAPPGGGSSQVGSLLSYDPEPSQPAQRAARGPASPPRGAPPAPFQQQPMAGAAPQSRGVSSNAFANGSNQNCGNVLTDRSTTRVAQPPGGRSSIVFG